MGMINFETSAQRSNERRKHPGTNGNGRRYSRDVDLSEPHIVNNSISSPQSRLRLFEQIILPHLSAAYNLARWLTRNEQDAEDVVQEAYLRAFRFFDSFSGGDGKVWLLAIVRNTCHTWRRRESQMAKVSFDEETHGLGEVAATVEGRLVDAVSSE